MPPKITASKKQKERMEVPVGQPIDMEFQVTGTPHPRVKFYHNDKELKASQEVQVSSRAQGGAVSKIHKITTQCYNRWSSRLELI